MVSIRNHGLKYAINKALHLEQNNSSVLLATNPILNLRNQNITYILTTKHCFFIAKLIQKYLNNLDIYSEIIFETPKSGFGSGVHFVICVQMFDELPDTYIAFQLEQSVSSRWFTDDYMKKLENSYAILDYSLENIKYLQNKGLYYNQIFFMPLAYNSCYEEEYVDNNDEYDVVFYGDVNNERRKKFLNKLSKHFKVKIVNEVFGEDLYKELNKAKVIVNIHYYENALLETTRLYECLSLNKIVVSETSSDIGLHKNIQECVDFVDIDDIDGMCDRVKYWLNNPDLRIKKINQNNEYLKLSPNWFEYYFMRFMLANDWISFDEFYSQAGKHIHFDTNFICLNLPESVDRTEDFQKDNQFGIQLFPALRHKKGWIGCGMSYKFMLMKAKEQEFKYITICEDDVEFKAGFLDDYTNIVQYLSQEREWDVFSGLIADLHNDVKIQKVIESSKYQYVYLNKMTSMVLNIYSNRFYDKLIKWNEKDHDVENNAIDRFIENKSSCTTIVTHPYLVGHKEDLNSTLWNASNSIYSEMIKNSEKKLSWKITKFNSRKKNER